MGCSISLRDSDVDMWLRVGVDVLRCGTRLAAQPSICRWWPLNGINKLRSDLRGSHLRKCGAQNGVVCEIFDGALAGRRKLLVADSGLLFYGGCRHHEFPAEIKLLQAEFLPKFTRITSFLSSAPSLSRF